MICAQWRRSRRARDELLETIRALRRGESRVTPQIARKVMDQFRRLAAVTNAESIREKLPNTPSSEKGPSGQMATLDTLPLSDKEEKILQLISESMSNRQIATTLFLAEGTVKNYVSRIMEKLHANTRTELALLSKKQSRPD
jgi:DNA-binding NarL/FixJ family response regulator